MSNAQNDPAVLGPVERQVRPLVNWCPCGDADCDTNRTIAQNATVALSAELSMLRGLLAQALALRAAPKWPLPGCDETAKASKKWWRSVEDALRPNV